LLDALRIETAILVATIGAAWLHVMIAGFDSREDGGRR